MSNEGYKGGSAWSPIFSITNEEKESFLKSYKEWNSKDSLYSFVFDALYKHGYDYTNKDTLEAIRVALLNQLIFNCDFARDILGDKDYQSACEAFKREQYSACQLVEIIKCFNLAWGHLKSTNGKPMCMDCSHIYPLLHRDIENQLSIIKSRKIEREYAPLKNVIDKITPGVKIECYLNATMLKAKMLESSINDYIRDIYNYDFNKASNDTEYVYSEDFGGTVNKVLQLALLNCEDFWKEKSFDIVEFINQVFENNGEEKAKKIIDYIFNLLNEDENISIFIKSNLSIGFSKKEVFIKKLKAYAQFTNISCELLYPMVEIENEEEKLCKGKLIFESFLYDFVYPSYKDKIRKFLLQGANDSIFNALNYDVLGYDIRGNEKNALSILMPEFFTMDRLWKRVYLKAYYLSQQFLQGELNGNLFNCFYNLFELIYKDLSIETAQQLDMEAREEGYKILKNMLKEQGVYISEKNKADYIASLIDIKSATLNEANRFDELFILGDSIYCFAVAELIFYNPKNAYLEYGITIQKHFENYTCQRGIIKIAKKIQLDKMYISASLHPSKYYYNCLKNTHIDFYEINRHDDKEKYLGDCLKMLLGAVALDNGYMEAINLAKKLIRDTYCGDFDYSNENTTNEDYCERIKPDMSVLNESPINRDYNEMMHDALYRLLGCLVLKTEDKDTRELISSSLYRVAGLFGDKGYFCEVSPSYYCYLDKGIDAVIKEYGEDAFKKYKTIKKL